MRGTTFILLKMKLKVRQPKGILPSLSVSCSETLESCNGDIRHSLAKLCECTREHVH